MLFPYLHRQNASKRAIQTFKAYLITYLCASNPKYPSKRVGYFTTARNFDSKSTPQLPLQYKTISTCSSPRHILLQKNTACPTWNHSPSIWEENQSPHLETPWHQRMVHWPSFRALFMHGMLHPINPQHDNFRQSWINFCIYPYFQDNFRGLFP